MGWAKEAELHADELLLVTNETDERRQVELLY